MVIPPLGYPFGKCAVMDCEWPASRSFTHRDVVLAFVCAGHAGVDMAGYTLSMRIGKPTAIYPPGVDPPI